MLNVSRVIDELLRRNFGVVNISEGGFLVMAPQRAGPLPVVILDVGDDFLLTTEQKQHFETQVLIGTSFFETFPTKPSPASTLTSGFWRHSWH